MSKTSRLKRLARQGELLKNFEGDFYQEKLVGDNWLVKNWNGGTNRWQVAIYSKESFSRYKAFTENKHRFEHLIETE